MKRTAQFLVVFSLSGWLGGCGSSEVPRLLSLAEQSRDQHVQATLQFAHALEDYAQASQRRAQEISALVSSSDSEELTEPQRGRLAELMAQDAAATDSLEVASFSLLDATLDTMALASVAYDVCRLSGIQPEILVVLDSLHNHYGDGRDVRAQYQQAVTRYQRQVEGLDVSSDCTAFKPVQSSLEEVIRKGALLLGNPTPQQSV